MTTLAFLAAFGAVITVTAEYVRWQANRDLAAKDQRITQLERQLAESQAQTTQLVTDSRAMWNEWAGR